MSEIKQDSNSNTIKCFKFESIHSDKLSHLNKRDKKPPLWFMSLYSCWEWHEQQWCLLYGLYYLKHNDTKVDVFLLNNVHYLGWWACLSRIKASCCLTHNKAAHVLLGLLWRKWGVATCYI